MIAQEVYDHGIEKMKTFSLVSYLPALRALNSGAMEDVRNTNGCANYQWIPGVLDFLKPKQIVELGGAMGVWDLMVLQTLPQDATLYSVTLPEHGLEFSYIVDKYTNFVPIVGDDLNTDIWPEGTSLFETNLWYFDSLHTQKQLEAELDLYSTWFKKGAVILFDDIHLSPEMNEVWEKIKNGDYGDMDCYDATDPLHYSGYGICVVL